MQITIDDYTCEIIPEGKLFRVIEEPLPDLFGLESPDSGEADPEEFRTIIGRLEVMMRQRLHREGGAI